VLTLPKLVKEIGRYAPVCSQWIGVCPSAGIGRSVEIAKGSFLVIQFADGWLTALEKRDRPFWVG
jgi:hypothetical protein